MEASSAAKRTAKRYESLVRGVRDRLTDRRIATRA